MTTTSAPPSFLRWLRRPLVAALPNQQRKPLMMMCGIVAAVAAHNVVLILLEGLKKLDYRSYNPVGLAIGSAAGLTSLRAVGRVAELANRIIVARHGAPFLVGVAANAYYAAGKAGLMTPSSPNCRTLGKEPVRQIPSEFDQ